MLVSLSGFGFPSGSSASSSGMFGAVKKLLVQAGAPPAAAGSGGGIVHAMERILAGAALPAPEAPPPAVPAGPFFGFHVPAAAISPPPTLPAALGPVVAPSAVIPMMIPGMPAGAGMPVFVPPAAPQPQPAPAPAGITIAGHPVGLPVLVGGGLALVVLGYALLRSRAAA